MQGTNLTLAYLQNTSEILHLGSKEKFLTSSALRVSPQSKIEGLKSLEGFACRFKI